MEKEIFYTKDLYGVFSSDGKFKIYHRILVDNKIQCLFDRYIPNNTIIKEEIKMFAPLVVYTEDDYSKVLNVNWPAGIIFTKDSISNKAVRMDIVLKKIFDNDVEQIDNDLLKDIENEINRKIKENSNIYSRIWKKVTNSDKNIAKKDKQIEKLMKGRSGMIDKTKIKRYVASTILGFTLFTGGCVAIREATIDHTKELCPITKILNTINPKDSSPLGVNLHQIPAMQKDYKDKGMENVAISYMHYEEEHVETVYSKSIGKKLENGEMIYIAPDGYTLDKIKNNGKHIYKKDITETRTHHYLEADAPYAKRLKID